MLIYYTYTKSHSVTLKIRPVFVEVMLIAAAMSNLIDRIAHRAVVDFIWVHWKDWYFPAFNIADMVITLSVIYIVIDTLSSDYEQNN